MPAKRCAAGASSLAAAMAAAAGLAKALDALGEPLAGRLAFAVGSPPRRLRQGCLSAAAGLLPSDSSATAQAPDAWQPPCSAAAFAGAAAAAAAAAVRRGRRPPPARGLAAQAAAPEAAAGDEPPVPPVWVVNLDKSVERWRKSSEELESNGIVAERFSATLGKAMTDAELEENATFGARYFCTPGMIGCFMSHLRIWRRVVEEGHPAVVALEDDVVVLHSDFNSRLQTLLKELPDDWDVCLLGAVGCICSDKEPFYMKLYGLITGGGRASPGKTRSISPNLFVPYRPAGTHAYMVSQKGAAKLAKLLPKARYHVDLAAWSLKELNLYAAKDQLATQRFDDDTTVSKQGAPWTKRFLRWSLDVSGLAWMGRRGGVPNLQWAWTIATFALPVPFSSTRRRIIVEMGPCSSIFVIIILLCIPLRSLKPLGYALAYLTSMISVIRCLAGTQKLPTFLVMVLLSSALIAFG